MFVLSKYSEISHGSLSSSTWKKPRDDNSPTGRTSWSEETTTPGARSPTRRKGACDALTFGARKPERRSLCESPVWESWCSKRGCRWDTSHDSDRGRQEPEARKQERKESESHVVSSLSCLLFSNSSLSHLSTHTSSSIH